MAELERHRRVRSVILSPHKPSKCVHPGLLVLLDDVGRRDRNLPTGSLPSTHRPPSLSCGLLAAHCAPTKPHPLTLCHSPRPSPPPHLRNPRCCSRSACAKWALRYLHVRLRRLGRRSRCPRAIDAPRRCFPLTLSPLRLPFHSSLFISLPHLYATTFSPFLCCSPPLCRCLPLTGATRRGPVLTLSHLPALSANMALFLSLSFSCAPARPPPPPPRHRRLRWPVSLAPPAPATTGAARTTSA